MSLIDKAVAQVINLAVMVWDFGIFLANLVTPSLKPGQVVPLHAAGHNLKWPEYVAPKPGDSRSACPMLNAMANHGILPHNADFLHRSYWTGRFDLAELSLHNAIEHDASLTRHDSALVPDQGKPDQRLVRDLLSEATGKMPDGSQRLTIPDLSRALSKRRVHAKQTNPKYSESFFHNMFGSANSSTMLTLFGGAVDDLRPMLVEERFSDRWEPRVLSRFGLTMAAFNGTVLPVELGVNTTKIE